MLQNHACVSADCDQCGDGHDPTHVSGPPAAEQLPLAVVLTCTTCDQSYEPTAEAVARGRSAARTRTAAGGCSRRR